MQDYIYLFLISMVPLIELRGAMIYAAVAEMPFLPSLLCCVIGNILPVPFLIKFAKTVLVYFSKIPKIGFIFQKIIDRGNKKAEKVRKAVLRKRVGMRTKMQFLLFRGMQMGEKSAWNPADTEWWKKQGWLEKKKPW